MNKKYQTFIIIVLIGVSLNWSVSLFQQTKENVNHHRVNDNQQIRYFPNEGTRITDDDEILLLLQQQRIANDDTIQLELEEQQYRDEEKQEKQQKKPKRQLDATRPLYVEHIMKNGGTFLCSLLSPRSGAGTNCRIDKESTFLFDPAINSTSVKAWFDQHPKYDNVIFSESGWKSILSNYVHDLRRFEHVNNATFWESYTTVLLIRDPIDRYISAQRMFIRWNKYKGANNDIVLYYQSNNFLTQHLVPGYRQNGKVLNCTQDVLAHAKSVIDKYDIIMTVSDTSALALASFHQNKSVRLPSAIKNDRREKKRSEKTSLSKVDLETLTSKNKCDLELYRYAQKREHNWGGMHKI